MPLPKFDRETGLYTLKIDNSYSWLTETTHPSEIEGMSDSLIQEQALIWAQAIMDQAFEDLEVEFVVWDEHNGFTEDDIQQHLLEEMPYLVAYLVDFMESYQVRPFGLETALKMIMDGAITKYEGLHIIHKEGSLDVSSSYNNPDVTQDTTWFEVSEYFKYSGVTIKTYETETNLVSYFKRLEIEEIYYQEWGDNDWLLSPVPEAYK